jgi:hypothetical protein
MAFLSIQRRTASNRMERSRDASDSKRLNVRLGLIARRNPAARYRVLGN